MRALLPAALCALLGLVSTDVRADRLEKLLDDVVPRYVHRAAEQLARQARAGSHRRRAALRRRTAMRYRVALAIRRHRSRTVRLYRARVRARLRARPAPKLAPRRKAGWGPGESMTHEVRIGGIEAARSAIVVGATAGPRGRKTVKVRAVGETIPLISALYRMREDLISHLMVDGLRPLTTTSKRQIRKSARQIVTTHQTPRARCSGAPAGKRRCRTHRPLYTRLDIRRGKRRWVRRHHLRWRVFDAIAALYHLRSTQLVRGKKIVLPVMSGTALYRVELVVKKRERLASKIGIYSCWRIDGHALRILSNGVPYPGKRPRAVSFWLTADRRRIPLKIAGRSKIGSIEALISSYRAPRRYVSMRALEPRPVKLRPPSRRGRQRRRSSSARRP